MINLVYKDLRRLAAKFFQSEKPNHTLQPTALVHEVYIRLAKHLDATWHSRTHFFAVASRALRRILVDHARERGAAKRGGDRCRVTLDGGMAVWPGKDIDLLALDEALRRLGDMDDRQVRVVEMRFFGGMTVTEVAETLGVSKRLVESDWTLARTWLYRELCEN